MIPNPQMALPARMRFSFPLEKPMMIHPTAEIKLNKAIHFFRPNWFEKRPQSRAPNIWEKLMILAGKETAWVGRVCVRKITTLMQSTFAPMSDFVVVETSCSVDSCGRRTALKARMYPVPTFPRQATVAMESH